MALNPKRTNEAANTACDAMAALVNGGFLDIYDGTQPATANTAITTQTLLASLPLANPAFAAASAGVAAANAITADISADDTGTATWFRVYKSDHLTGVWDGSVGTAAANLNLVSTSIVTGGVVAVSSFILTESKG